MGEETNWTYRELFDEVQKENQELKRCLAEAEKVLKDICHHVSNNCFATCKGDYVGTSCFTYKIWDALRGEAEG